MYKIYCDGGVSKKRKYSAIYDPQKDRRVVRQYSCAEYTNNDCEYLAVILAITYVIENKIFAPIEILTDSQLIVGHLYRNWTVNKKFREYIRVIRNFLENTSSQIRLISREEQLAHID